MAFADVNSEAFEAAEKEGLSYFWFHRHIGGSSDFVGTCWEDGAITVDEDGNPKCDWRGNSIAKYSAEKLDVTNKDHLAAVEVWYG